MNNLGPTLCLAILISGKAVALRCSNYHAASHMVGACSRGRIKDGSDVHASDIRVHTCAFCQA